MGSKEISLLAKCYLLAYNGVLSIGWFFVLWPAVSYTIEHKNGLVQSDGLVPGLYLQLRTPLVMFQTAAILEVVHCVVGLVSSSVMTTLMQVYSRLFVLWALIEGVLGISDSVGVLLIAYAWGITEIIRYAYYFFAILKMVPYPLVWCRYTFFYVLYPLGVLGEMLLFFGALPVVKASKQWNLTLPNQYNLSFSFYYLLIFTMMLYIPLFPQLYGHMIKQRGKTIGSSSQDLLKKDK